VLYVELHADGAVWVDGEQRELAALPRVLAALDISRYESGIVAVDPGVPLQRAVDVIDRLGASGLDNVLLREARQFE
jgi:biopolymer transport protein ExbD